MRFQSDGTSKIRRAAKRLRHDSAINEVMEPDKRLLDHEFYQAWERGDVTEEQLADYATAYQKFMDTVPEYWQQVLTGLEIDDPQGAEIVAEEQEHATMWEEWRGGLPEVSDAAELNSLLSALDEMTPAELAGAIHAYEVQQPEVAETKKAGLIDHYGFDEDELAFFDEHIEGEDEHIAFGAAIREKCSDPDAFDRGFQKGANRIYHSLDAFTAS